jgi:hypothetical protein
LEAVDPSAVAVPLAAVAVLLEGAAEAATIPVSAARVGS